MSKSLKSFLQIVCSLSYIICLNPIAKLYPTFGLHSWKRLFVSLIFATLVIVLNFGTVKAQTTKDGRANTVISLDNSNRGDNASDSRTNSSSSTQTTPGDQLSPMAALLRDKIAQIIKDGNLIDPNYLEKLFSVKFSPPKYKDLPKLRMGGKSGLVSIERIADLTDPTIQTTKSPAFFLDYISYFQKKTTPSNPQQIIYSTLKIEENVSAFNYDSYYKKNCLKIRDLQPFFDAPSSQLPNSMDNSSIYRFTKLYTSKTITVDLNLTGNYCTGTISLSYEYVTPKIPK